VWYTEDGHLKYVQILIPGIRKYITLLGKGEVECKRKIGLNYIAVEKR
jgi:hypothetical protein